MIDENKNISEKTTIACITLISFNQFYLTTTTIIKRKYACMVSTVWFLKMISFDNQYVLLLCILYNNIYKISLKYNNNYCKLNLHKMKRVSNMFDVRKGCMRHKTQ